MSSESWSQFDPMLHFGIYGDQHITHSNSHSQLVMRPRHCWFCYLLMQNTSSSKQNTDDYSGHEGDVMHHLVQTN